MRLAQRRDRTVTVRNQIISQPDVGIGTHWCDVLGKKTPPHVIKRVSCRRAQPRLGRQTSRRQALLVLAGRLQATSRALATSGIHNSTVDKADVAREACCGGRLTCWCRASVIGVARTAIQNRRRATDFKGEQAAGNRSVEGVAAHQ